MASNVANRLSVIASCIQINEAHSGNHVWLCVPHVYSVQQQKNQTAQNQIIRTHMRHNS